MGISTGPDNVIFTCICREPEGDIIRTVRRFEFTKENLQALYSRVSRFPTLMGLQVTSLEDMLRVFLNDDMTPKGLCMVVDDLVGLFYLTDIKALHEASVHYTFFDRRHRGRVELCKKSIEYAFKTFQFHRLHTMIPITQVHTLNFVEQLGFKRVGRFRENTYFKGKYCDSVVYDILKEEYLDGVSAR